MPGIPVIELSQDPDRVAARIDGACRTNGFFVVTDHGIDPDLLLRLETAARAFFALPGPVKAEVAMDRGGRAWRGWFPPGGELTSGVPDGKEGLYLGQHLGPEHPRVRAGTPLHGPNLVPDHPADLAPAVDATIAALTDLGHRLLSLMATGLGLAPDWFRTTITADPTVLFRIFHYPPAGTVPGASWGVQEHTDYGLLTILAQDDVGGLEVRAPEGWVPVPPVPGSFVCNLGDMLERMTGGAYRSTPHRVRIPDRGRLSFPFFFDPSWDSHIGPIPGLGDEATVGPAPARWDGRSVFDHDGTYGDYLIAKVARVFPELWTRVSDGDDGSAPVASG